MPYIGNTPADKFLTLAKQNFSTSATTSYTLDSAVSSTQDIALFINNVRQSPVDAYTVSGTALTLTSATAGTDEMYCVYLGKTVGTVSPSANSITNAMMTDDSVGLAELSATGTASSSTFLRGDNSWASAGGTNTPYFQASITSNQSLTHDTTTKINFDRADVDSASGYDTSNKRYTIPSGQGGLYHIGYTLYMQTTGDNLWITAVYPRKNGSNFPNFNSRQQGAFYARMDGNPVRDASPTKSFIANLSAGDYIEIYGNGAHTSGGSSTITAGEYYSIFWGYKLIT